MTVKVPPIKSQGIKTKLVPWIKSLIPDDFDGMWIEPFMGTGVVAFNVMPERALLCDSNPHLINFYQGISDGTITAPIVRRYLNKEGAILADVGESHYYYIRQRFNDEHNPLDFLFLNRAGFNGMIRFNRKGGFNIPFCKKPERFAKAYVTKIVNQVDYVSQLLKFKKYTFICQDFETTLQAAGKNDIIYCDPPYIGRYVDYYNGWTDDDENNLFNALDATDSKFILSTWHHNDFRENEYIPRLWNKFNVFMKEHFYHIGGKEKNRNPMIEAIIANFEAVPTEYVFRPAEQLALLEPKADYKSE